MNSPAQLLIIDDEPRMCDSLKAMLQPHNFAIATAHSGHQALDLINEAKFDLILMDYVLPDMSAPHLMENIRRQAPETALIVMTGFASVDKAIYAFKQGAYDFIEKPFNYEALIKKINAAIQSKAKTINRPVIIKMPHDRFPIPNKRQDRLPDVVIDHPQKAAFNNRVHQIHSIRHDGPGNIPTSDGILPMCSHCKKVRDEQGEWIQIEKFIEQHAHAKCSHSLCPACEGHLYPGMDLNPE